MLCRNAKYIYTRLWDLEINAFVTNEHENADNFKKNCTSYAFDWIGFDFSTYVVTVNAEIILDCAIFENFSFTSICL
jgi:hypothetical protein